jgi:hypothetical protein
MEILRKEKLRHWQKIREIRLDTRFSSSGPEIVPRVAFRIVPRGTMHRAGIGPGRNPLTPAHVPHCAAAVCPAFAAFDSISVPMEAPRIDSFHKPSAQRRTHPANELTNL